MWVLGLVVHEKELLDLQYLLKREMEEILLDLNDERIERVIKRAMKERYRILFKLLTKVAPQSEYAQFAVSYRREMKQ